MLLVLASPSWSAPPGARFADVVTLHGETLESLCGWPIERLTVLACTAAACEPIPMQVDERDPSGAWALDSGPQPSADTPAGIFDRDDVVLFMADDAGVAAAPAQLPSSATVLQVAVVDALAATRRWVYVVGYAERAPRAAHSYVEYDPSADRFSGAKVQMGFEDGVPTFMSIDGGAGNLLDRLKVRAAASVFWGWLRFTRSEADLTTELVGWHAGPIRVVRHQKQRVRLGWGIRSPTFRSYTYFYRDFAELPVGLRLNFPPTYFFSDILIEVVLDFRDLTGWQLYLPQQGKRVQVGDVAAHMVDELNRAGDMTFALRGPRLTLLQTFSVSASLEPVHKHLIYRDDGRPQPPESVVGERPGVGYALERWEAVGAGEHGLKAVSYALPADVDVDEFVRALAAPLRTIVEPAPGD